MRDVQALVKRIGPLRGTGMHYFPHRETRDAEHWATVLESLGIDAVTLIDPDLGTLLAMKRHGIKLVLYRFFRRAYQPYSNNGNPVQTMQAAGYVPIIEVNCEDELSEEWDGGDPNWMVSGPLLIDASVQVYNQGGVVGWQMLDQDYLRYCINLAREQGHMEIFESFVFIPHDYGLNHKPNYTQDQSAFLGYRWFAEVFQQELGFIPPFICGEMGWCVGSEEDNRYPRVTEELLVEYMGQVIDSLRTGILPDGQPIPDYLLSFHFWILGSCIMGGDLRFEQAAIYKASGEHLFKFIDYLKSLPPFVRRFTWDDTPDPIDPPDEEEPMPEFVFGFKELHDKDPETVGDATDDQMDIFGGDRKISFQATTKGLLVWTPSGGVKFFGQTLPKV